MTKGAPCVPTLPLLAARTIEAAEMVVAPGPVPAVRSPVPVRIRKNSPPAEDRFRFTDPEMSLINTSPAALAVKTTVPPPLVPCIRTGLPAGPMSAPAPRNIVGLLISPFRPSEILHELQPRLICPLDPVPLVPTSRTGSLPVGSYMNTLPLVPPVGGVRLTGPLPIL